MTAQNTEAPSGAFNFGVFSDLDPPARKNGTTYPHPTLGPLDRITSILGVINKPFLLQWAARIERETILEAVEMGNRSARAVLDYLGRQLGTDDKGQPKLAMNAKRDTAAATGGNAHDALEAFLKGTPTAPLSDEEKAAYQAGRAWMVDREVIPIGVERRVYSPALKMAGTLDLCCELEHEGSRIHAVVDWKTSSGHYFEQLAQIAFYSECLREAGYPEPLHGVVVRLPKDGSPADPRYYSPTHMERYTSFLVAAGILYRAQKEYEAEFARYGRR